MSEDNNKVDAGTALKTALEVVAVKLTESEHSSLVEAINLYLSEAVRGSIEALTERITALEAKYRKREEQFTKLQKDLKKIDKRYS